MKRIGYHSLAGMVLAIGLFASATAFAQTPNPGITCPGDTPIPNGAVVTQRVFNDCPTSLLTVINNYPAQIIIDDAQLDCFGYANLHVWRLSSDGGQTPAMFENCSHYRAGANVTLDGTGVGEGGIALFPWWSLADGKFMLNASSGEIACFGGRLPFYSFTVNHGLHYLKGTKVYMEMTYDPRSLSSAFPATILYKLYMNGVTYYSPYLAFDEGNLTEGATYGFWGELSPAYPGGYVQPYVGNGVPVEFRGTFDGFQFEGPSATPTQSATWGRIKTLYR